MEIEKLKQVESETQKINQGFEQSRKNEVVSRLLAGEDLQKILESLPGFSESFDNELDTIDCSDGRVLDGKKIGIAGSGLLLPDQERALFVERFRGKIKEVTTHYDCGAAKIGFEQARKVFPETIPAEVTTADEYGSWRGKKLAEELGATHKYLGSEELANEYHNEVAIVIDQTGRFDSTNLENFPAHFVCTGAGLGFSEEYMKAELKTLTGIALGHHGFGERFTPKDPFYLIVAANNYAELLTWEKVAQEVARGFKERVLVKSFIRPTK